MKPENIAKIIIVIAVIVGMACAMTQQSPRLGGDRDEHGCIPSAGYLWCPEKQKCLRIWEESCPSVELAAQAASFCGQTNVAAVYVCGDYFRVVSSMPGAGSTIYKGSDVITCPLVSPTAMSDQCKLYILAQTAQK